MGFKVDTSFLRYLTMGALGTRHVIAELRDCGFEPIELERYTTSNKIWATKVKRLRLPDLLCVRTGLKVEVRAKSTLAIRMSDAPGSPDRVWDAGADDEDVVAFVACRNAPGGPVPVGKAVYFDIGSLRRSVSQSRLGSAKSGAEGAERQRNWPATVPSDSGTVVSVTPDRLIVQMDSGRRHTYRIDGRYAYVEQGKRFAAGLTFLAGVPDGMSDLTPRLSRRYDPVARLESRRASDRYAAAKAIRFRPDRQRDAIPLLQRALEGEREPRVALEVAGTAMALGLRAGMDRIEQFMWADNDAELSMEAILILTEIGGDFTREQLALAAKGDTFRGDERRQAAVWGLGKAGVKAYGDLLPYLGDADENVAFHAIAAFGHDTPSTVIRQLIKMLADGDQRLAPAASEALRTIGGGKVIEALVELVTRNGPARTWALATLGRLEPGLVREKLNGLPLLAEIEPMLLMAQGANWLTEEDALVNFAFLSKQAL